MPRLQVSHHCTAPPPIGTLASGRLPRERWIIDEERWNLDSLFDRLKRELVKAGTIRAGLTFHGLRKSLSKKAALPRTKKPKCFGNTAAPVPLLRSLIAGGKEPDIQRSLSAPLDPVPASSASATYASNMMTERRTLPDFMLAKPSLISGNLMRAEIQSSRCSRPLR